MVKVFHSLPDSQFFRNIDIANFDIHTNNY